MQRHEKVAEALGMFPARIRREPAARSWSPSRQVECIDAFKHELERLQKLIKATSTLVEYGHSLTKRLYCAGELIEIEIEHNVRHEPTVVFTINERLIDKIEQYMVLDPNVEHDVGVHILCIMEATSEYLYNRIAEELKFLDHITEEISTETEKTDNTED